MCVGETLLPYSFSKIQDPYNDPKKESHCLPELRPTTVIKKGEEERQHYFV